MVNDFTTLSTYNLQPNFLILQISNMISFGKKTSNFHEKQASTGTLNQKVCLFQT